MNKKSISNYETQLFQTELEKFRPHQNRLLQANHKQSALMKELTASFNNLLQDKRVRSEQSKYEAIQRQRASVVNRYKRAYQDFLDLESGLQSAKRWYAEMKETVESLEKNVETFVNNRRSEGAQLLDQIEQERAANKSAQAEVERERLRSLMERMSMDPSGSNSSPSSSSPPPPKPPSARPVPTPLNFTSSAPSGYPQTNFVGQYQIPRSPPPPGQPGYHPGYSSPPPGSTFSPGGGGHPHQQQQQQQSYTLASQQQQQPPATTQAQFGQAAAYNPSSWGRNPGPTSPPPTQTTFGLGRGPASPPPTQTTAAAFGGHHQYSTYGNPQATPQPQPVQHQQQPQHHHQHQHHQHQHQPSGQYNNMPPGFLPPPPPPGPPPLGPQQTYHYNTATTATIPQQQHMQQQQQQQQSSPPPPHQPHQQQNDPWAGLSAWR